VTDCISRRCSVDGLKQGAGYGCYPNAIWDEEQQRFISDAQVAEVPNTRVHLPAQVRAGARAPNRATGRAPEPDERPSRAGRAVRHLPHHAVFTDTAFPMLEAERPTGPTPPSNKSTPTCGMGPWPSALTVVLRKWCRAGPGRDRVQPHSRRRCHRIHVPRQGHHRVGSGLSNASMAAAATASLVGETGYDIASPLTAYRPRPPRTALTAGQRTGPEGHRAHPRPAR
jgi:hypothetical protein